MFVLDTDYLGILQNQDDPAFLPLWNRISEKNFDNFYLAIISFHEQVGGWYTYLAKAKETWQVIKGYRMFQGILKDFTTFHVLPYDEAAVNVFETIRKEKVRIGTMDLRIGAITIANKYTLLSRNLVDFQKIPGLRVEDWTAGPPR
jgi:tRNA(fMet)-specific endonuclease VapC